MTDKDLTELLSSHREKYPAMEAQDAFKLIFQAMLGCGHLIADESAARRRIEDEERTLTPDAAEALYTPIGPDWMRLNLRPAMAKGISPEWIARMMTLSAADAPGYSREDVARAAQTQGLHDPAERMLRESAWLPGHSEAYRSAYAPAYRVIRAEFAQTLEVLSALSHLCGRSRVLVGIDGPSGSGKSTLAGHLSDVLDAAVVHMDDFFLPHAQKTPERLALPGGNADIERFRDEFLRPWQQKGEASYRPYSCHLDAMEAPVTVPVRRVTLVEGSYALHPALGQPYDLRVFLRVTEAEQRRRILLRNGPAMLKRFLDTWIPLEQAYFAAFALPDASCLTPSPYGQER